MKKNDDIRDIRFENIFTSLSAINISICYPSIMPSKL